VIAPVCRAAALALLAASCADREALKREYLENGDRHVAAAPGSGINRTGAVTGRSSGARP